MRPRHIAAAAILAALTLTACSSNDEPAEKPPAYKVVKQDTSGNSRSVEVEVDSTERLRAVFDAVTANLTDNAGYHVSINCSTGGTSAQAHRLANGRKAVGNIGQAATGLDDGAVEYKPLQGATCP